MWLVSDQNKLTSLTLRPHHTFTTRIHPSFANPPKSFIINLQTQPDTSNSTSNSSSYHVDINHTAKKITPSTTRIHASFPTPIKNQPSDSSHKLPDTLAVTTSTSVSLTKPFTPYNLHPHFPLQHLTFRHPRPRSHHTKNPTPFIFCYNALLQSANDKKTATQTRDGRIPRFCRLR